MIEVNNIKKKIGDKLILDDISLNLDKGKIYGFRGRNGSGKTMLFRAICGLITIDQGYIVVDGLKLANKHFPADIGLLLENPAFLPELSGYDNLEMIASIRNVVGKERIEEVIEIVGLTDAKDKAFGKYS
ncbi:MAG: ATP-binding cassette domain-containing protein, partial [Peptoniphilus grossensis]